MRLTPLNIGKLFNSNSLNEGVNRTNKGVKTKEGDILRIKIIDYLGDGKLVVNLKGQRIVADSNLMIETDQEIDVIVKTMENNRIILQVLSEDQIGEGLQTEHGGLSNQIEDLRQFNNSQYTCFEVPLFFEDQEAISLIGFHSQSDGQTSNLIIAVELKNLGYMEFTINIADQNFNCHILSDNKDTCQLTQQFSSDLKECFSKLGYKVENIDCSLRRLFNAQYLANHLDTSV
jgi:hypothetical protein